MTEIKMVKMAAVVTLNSSNNYMHFLILMPKTYVYVYLMFLNHEFFIKYIYFIAYLQFQH